MIFVFVNIQQESGGKLANSMELCILIRKVKKKLIKIDNWIYKFDIEIRSTNYFILKKIMNEVYTDELPNTDFRAINVDIRAIHVDINAINVDIRAINVDIKAINADIRVITAHIMAINADIRDIHADIRGYTC